MEILVFLLALNLADTDEATSLRDTVIIDSVPFVHWNYSSSATSIAMVLWYWDFREYGRLVDFFFNRWNPPVQQWEYNLPNIITEISVALGDTLDSLPPPIWFIDTAIVQVANTINGYDFESQTSPQGGSWNQYQFTWIKNEIDNGRPCIWCVLNYWCNNFFDFINHSLCAVGYIIAPTDTFIIVHNTWIEQEEVWPLWTYHQGIYSYDYVVTVVPGGANSDNIFITFPTDSNLVFHYNEPVDITWDSYGSEIKYVKIWYASTYDSTEWTLIDSSAPNTGTYTWIVPETSLFTRINLQGFNLMDSLEATDGSFYRFTTEPIGIAEHDINTKKFFFNISPNIFADHLTIEFSALVTKPVFLEIYDVSGRLIKNFSRLTPYDLRPTLISWDGKDNKGQKICSGIYFISLKQANKVITKKVIYLPHL